MFDWKPPDAADGSSEACGQWLVRDQPAGIYRVVYYGLANRARTTTARFTGTSCELELREAADANVRVRPR